MRSIKIPMTEIVVANDAHTHLLPGVDDGGFTLRTAAETLTKMYDLGVRRVCLTPHVMAGVWDNSSENLRETMQIFVRSLPLTAAGDGIEGGHEATPPTTSASSTLPDILSSKTAPRFPELHLGAEYMVDDELLRLITGGDEVLTVDGRRVLVEMSYWSRSPQLTDVIAALTARGYIALLAHPERYLYMGEDDFGQLHDAGCEFQLDLGAATGAGGQAATKIVNLLMERGWYTRAGSDIHSPRQLETILNSSMDEKTAAAGEAASLWQIL
jgi:protein-tyrosine phosphatase